MYDWSDEYCIGVKKIDGQHKQLFKIAARIEDIISDGDEDRSKRATIEAIKYLEDYTLEHFSNEEAFQIANNYSGYEKHKKQHEDFKVTISEYNTKLIQTDYDTETVTKFVNVIKEWLVYHIMQSDQSIAKEISEKGINEE